MVQVKSSRGGTVTVSFTGLNETINRLREFYKVLPTAEGIGVLKAADYVKEEVKESIVGNRGEPKSVDTGNFANSINIKPNSDKELVVYTDVEYAKFLEYGTSKIEPRKHFNNTVFRVQNKVKDIVKVEIDNTKKKAFD
jgi:HK97 gp10 family phage protein